MSDVRTQEVRKFGTIYKYAKIKGLKDIPQVQI